MGRNFTMLFRTLLLSALIFQGLPGVCSGQSVSINVEAPELAVDLLNPDGTLNQNPTLCSDTQAFSGRLSPEAASAIAEARCRVRLLEGAVYNLKISPLLSSLQTESTPLNYGSIAQSLSRIMIVEQADPASGEAGNQIALVVELTPLYPDLSTAIKAGIADQDFQYLQAQALALEKDSLLEVERLLPQVLNDESDGSLLKKHLNRLSALDLCRRYLEPPKSALPNSEDRVQQIEQAMNQAARLDPSNPLVFCILGANQLQSGRTAQAVASYSQALKFNNAFLPALSGRGTAYLRLNLIDLALADFNQAITLNKDNPAYYMARASALLMREDFPAMCQDFRTACGKGECEGYNWAVNSGHCK